MFLLWLRQLPQCGDQITASVPSPTEGRSSPTNTPVFSPSSFILPSFAWFYIFFCSGQVLLSTFSRCSACTSVSESIFLMYPWGEMYYNPPTPPPSCCPLLSCFSVCLVFFFSWKLDISNIIVGNSENQILSLLCALLILLLLGCFLLI